MSYTCTVHLLVGSPTTHLVPRELFNVNEDSHQLWNCHRRVSVVQLNRDLQRRTQTPVSSPISLDPVTFNSDLDLMTLIYKLDLHASGHGIQNLMPVLFGRSSCNLDTMILLYESDLETLHIKNKLVSSLRLQKLQHYIRPHRQMQLNALPC